MLYLDRSIAFKTMMMQKSNCFKFLKNNYLENIKCESLLGNYLERPFGNKDVNTKVYKG